MSEKQEKCKACGGIGYSEIEPPGPFKGIHRMWKVGCFPCGGTGKRQVPLRDLLKEFAHRESLSSQKSYPILPQKLSDQSEDERSL